jgi:hypothetical protein
MVVREDNLPRIMSGDAGPNSVNALESPGWKSGGITPLKPYEMHFSAGWFGCESRGDGISSS